MTSEKKEIKSLNTIPIQIIHIFFFGFWIETEVKYLHSNLCFLNALLSYYVLKIDKALQIFVISEYSCSFVLTRGQGLALWELVSADASEGSNKKESTYP